MSKTKKLTQKIFKLLEEQGYHVKNVEYGQYYMLFDFGKDGAVHFRIKELKHWKFGIWWHHDNGEVKSYDFFMEHDDALDKFKPSAVTFKKEGIFVDQDSWDFHHHIIPMLKFVKRHPYRAWGYVTSSGSDVALWAEHDGCFAEYWEYQIKYNWLYPKFYDYVCKQYCKIVSQIGDHYLVNPKLHDGNANGCKCTPRYELICDNFRDTPVKKKGFYHLFKIDFPVKLAKKVSAYQRKWEFFKKHGFFFHDIQMGEVICCFVKAKKEKK